MPSLILEKMLREFGLCEKEISAYFVCLELGTSHAALIARKAGLNRSSCYAVLEDLIKKGLVNKSGTEKKFQFTAENPERLILLIQEQHNKINDLKKKFTKLLPELKSIYDNTEELPKVKFIEGAQGIKAIYEDTWKLVPKGEEYWHCNPDMDALVDLLGKDWLLESIKVRVKKGIKSRLITNKTPWAQKEAQRDKKVQRETVFLPEEMKLPARLHIYANKVAVFSLKKEPLGVLIEDKDIADMMRIFYDSLWRRYKK